MAAKLPFKVEFKYEDGTIYSMNIYQPLILNEKPTTEQSKEFPLSIKVEYPDSEPFETFRMYDFRKYIKHAERGQDIIHQFSDETVKSCPFCGDPKDECLELRETDNHSSWFVWCSQCGAEGPPTAVRKWAIYLWNDRIGTDE